MLNIDDDHPENYAGLPEVGDAFAQFVAGIAEDGTLIACADDPAVRALLARVGGARRTVTYGTASGPIWAVVDAVARGRGCRVQLRSPARRTVRFGLSVPGLHQAYAAVAALVTAVELGCDVDSAARALESFAGVQRRLTMAGEVHGVAVLDSFAHHPTAIAADLSAARSMTGVGGRVLVLFEPTGSGRVAVHGKAMYAALQDGAERVAVMKLPSGVADDTDLPVTSTGKIFGGAQAPKAALSEFAGAARPGDVVVLMGTTPLIAGLGEWFVDQLAQATELALS